MGTAHYFFDKHDGDLLLHDLRGQEFGSFAEAVARAEMIVDHVRRFEKRTAFAIEVHDEAGDLIYVATLDPN